MKSIHLLLLFVWISIRPVASSPLREAGVIAVHDTSLPHSDVDTVKENKVITEVIGTKKIKKERAAYLNEVTKYGFKDLFKNYTYNPSIPYTDQVNPFAENYMEDYLKAHQEYLLKLRKTGRPYFNFIDGILSQYGLPRELKYLAVIESDLKSTALSPKGARGPWQFMPSTARGLGLVVNGSEDDRTDYYKSTNAASRYLLSLYKDLKDWLLVIAAYNGGEGRVYSAIRKSGSRNFWKLQYYLPEESRNHVKNFIATHYIMETGNTDGNVASAGFDYNHLSANDSSSLAPRLSDAEKKDVDSVQVSGRYIGSVIAGTLGMSATDFGRYNPGFDAVLATGANYTLRLPADKMEQFRAKKFQILDESVNQLLQGVRTEGRIGKTDAVHTHH